MAHSLLAHLYSRIKGSQEDIATVSLQYILSSSPELTKAFNAFLSDHLKHELPSRIQYVCQSVGDNKERPDMAGIDNHGKEQLLFEMKFYASLTANQPLTYLERLKSKEGIGLVFVCPQARVISLWAKLLQLCENQEVEKVDDYCVKINGIHMTIVSWAEVIHTIRHAAVNLCPEFLSDIDQLSGYCQQMDSEAFLPFREEDLGSDVARREERYAQVLDALIDSLCASDQHETSLKRLKASPQRSGYARYIYMDGFALNISYDRKRWMYVNSVDTPFWMTIYDDVSGSHWHQSETVLYKLQAIKQYSICELWGVTAVALIPLINATLDEVVEDLQKQVEGYLDFVK